MVIPFHILKYDSDLLQDLKIKIFLLQVKATLCNKKNLIAGLSKKWNMPFNSVKTGVSRLAKIGIFREATGRRRNKLFIAPELMELLIASDKR